jgi:large subunit ribosomal protein L25
VLNIVRHEIAVRCPADAIPDHFEVDLTGLEIGDSVHISAVKLPEGVRPTITERTSPWRPSSDAPPKSPCLALLREAACRGAEGAEAVEAAPAAKARQGEGQEKRKEKPKEREKKKR